MRNIAVTKYSFIAILLTMWLFGCKREQVQRAMQSNEKLY